MISVSMLEDLRMKSEEYRSIIFERDILELGYSLSNVESLLEKNVFEEIDASAYGIGRVFGFAIYSSFTDSYYLPSIDIDVLEYYFIGKDFKYGYLTEFSSLNFVGASTQVMGTVTVKSTLVSECRTLQQTIGGIIVRPLTNNYNKDDAYYIMVADAFNNYINAFDYKIDVVVKKMYPYIRNISKLCSMIVNEDIRRKVYSVFTRE